MRRVFWVAVGATVGIVVVRKVSKAAQAYTPSGLAQSAAGLGDSVRYFADQVRLGMAEREAELRDALGVDVASPSGDHLPPEAAARLIDHPSRDWRGNR